MLQACALRKGVVPGIIFKMRVFGYWFYWYRLYLYISPNVRC